MSLSALLVPGFFVADTSASPIHHEMGRHIAGYLKTRLCNTNFERKSEIYQGKTPFASENCVGYFRWTRSIAGNGVARGDKTGRKAKFIAGYQLFLTI
jgi:hypothetical protein